jgi:single-strand DNA-binding protein
VPDDPTDRNDVVLVGRVSAEPQTRELPSGDPMLSFRVVVRRPEGSRSSVPVDTLDCTAWRADVRRVVARWRPGDRVELQGAVRRRFWRAGGGGGAPSSRWEIEVSRARRLERAR